MSLWSSQDRKQAKPQGPDPGDTGWGKLSIETFRQFFPWAVTKVNWGYLKLDLTWGSIVRTIDLISSWWGALPGAGIRMVNDREGYNVEAKLTVLLRQKC